METQNEVSELNNNFKLTDRLTKIKKINFIQKFIILSSGIVIITLFIGLVLIWFQMKDYRYQQKIQYQMLYNINQSAFTQKRKKVATLWLTRLALIYNANWNEKRLARVIDIIYEIGERKYNIKCEFWGILIAYESDWIVKSESHAGALGLMQIMPVITSHICDYLDIKYLGNLTRLNPENNVRIGMRYMYDLIQEYGFKYGVCGYNYGEREISEWRAKKIFPKEKMKYWKGFLEEWMKIEEKLGERIHLSYVSHKEYMEAHNDYYNTKVEEIKKDIEEKTNG